MTRLKALRLSLVFTLSFFPFIAAQASNKIVAVVNDEIVTQNQLNQVIYVLKQQSQAAGNPMSAEKIRKEALNQLINNKLMLQIAKQNNITTTDAEVNQQIQIIASQNGLPLDKFKEALAKEGSSFKAYQEFVKNQITLNKLRSQFLGAKIKVTEKDIQAEMAMAKKMDTGNAPVQVLDVLISPVSANDMTHAKEAATKIRQELMNGKELKASIKVAENPKVKITGQDLGWKALAELPDLFANAVKTLPAGQVTKPVEAPNGVHLLIMLNRKGGGTFTRQDAERMAAGKKMQAEVEKWLAEIKKQAYIEIK